VVKPGGTVELEYDIPPSAWYFDQNGHRTMPFCVLLEAALQPCGWLASFVGSALTTETDLKFRNLDGTGTLTADLLPDAGTLRTCVKLTNISQSAGMIIESFEVQCYLGDTRVYDLKTVFGFFPAEAFENQVGLPVSPEERARFERPGDFHVDLRSRPERYCAGSPRLAGPMLLMLDRVTVYDPTGGARGLGYLRAEKDIDPGEWFFKAHFFQDPVQPGSLGLEALCQLAQFYVLERGLAAGVPHARFEPLRLGHPLTWRYRGQVTPRNGRMTSEFEVTEVGQDAQGPYVVGNAWLWVDGKRIYSATGLGVRAVAGEAPADGWLGDHRPTFTVPAVPMMSMIDALGAAVRARTGSLPWEFPEVQVRRWLPAPAGMPALRTEVTETDGFQHVTLSAWREAGDRALSRFEPVAVGRARVGAPGAPAAEFAPLADLEEVPDPYASGALIHGPAFQYLVSLRRGRSGSSAVLDLARGAVPRGAYHQGVLDAMTHGIPHDGLWRWSGDIPQDRVAYPYRVYGLRFFSPIPDTGRVGLEARFAGFDGDLRFPKIDLQLVRDHRVLVALTLVEVLLPKGAFGSAPPEDRRAFLRDRRWVPGLSLATVEGDETVLTEAAVRGMDWLPGTVAAAYAVPPSGARDLVARVAVQDHVARRACVHPATVRVDDGLTTGVASVRPLRAHAVAVTRDGDRVRVRDAGPPVQDLGPVRRWWRTRIGVGPWPVEDLYYGLVGRFVRDVVLSDPEALRAVEGRSCLFLGNHQVGVESLLFSVLASALTGTPTVTLAKAEHRTSWLGTLIAHNFSYPGVRDPDVIRFFDRDDRASLVKIVEDLAAAMRSTGKNVMVHVEGTRSLECRTPVLKMSSAFIDMALAVRAPIVPVRFVGGLPTEPLPARLEFPLGHGAQDYWLGAPLLPERLEALPYKQRKELVLAAINGLGPPAGEERPSPGDAAFAQAAEAWRARTGTSSEHATLYATLASLPDPHPEVRALLAVARGEDPGALPEDRRGWLTELGGRLGG
jgi:3-hydroxymyristoyl/3-hydroxydecanoyl-(acyl carrier protein) dehydratase/1-acyl-sn-glycerol-3-phosphate acyltransferase